MSPRTASWSPQWPHSFPARGWLRRRPERCCLRQWPVVTTLYIETARLARLARLDALAIEAGVSRSELVREALRRHLPRQ